jgi:hypothetical protein
MVSGRLRAPRTDGPSKGTGILVVKRRAKARSGKACAGRAALALCVLAALCSLSLSSCGKAIEERRLKAFSASIAEIDEIIVSRASSSLSDPERKKLGSAFSRALASARADAEWLGLLKRARLASSVGDSGRWLQVADRAVSARPSSDPVAAAAAQAYLRGGRPSSALALFGRALSADARPALWAEAFIAANSGSQAASSLAAATSADYARLAEATGEPRAYLGAAALALAANDKDAAGSWLRVAMAKGVRPSAELLWDCGLYAELSSAYDLGLGSRDLALMGDAAWLSGSKELAARRWERSIALGPKRSYKSYEKLALVSEGEAAQSYWGRLKAAFLSGPPSVERDGALGAYAAYLVRGGREAEALSILEPALAGRASGGKASGRLAVLSLAIRSASMPEGRMAALYERLAAERPDDPEVMGAALKTLSRRGMYGEVAVLGASAASRGLKLEYGWYYEALVLAARGEFAAAIGVVKAHGARSAEGLFALGSLYEASGDLTAAAEAYSRSAAASGGEERCAAYKALGAALGSSGDGEGAAAAYRAALAASPEDAEAAMLARQSERKAPSN